MTKDSALVNIEKNKKTGDINVIIGNNDKLSRDNIHENNENVNLLEAEFTDRINYSEDELSKQLLPKELQSDFKIKASINGDKLKYNTSAITEDAYEKYPMRINFTMQFPTVEEAKLFRNGGMKKLLDKAEETGKPVDIPNIIGMRKFIGEYEDPLSKSEHILGSKIIVYPQPMPPAQNYEIELFNSSISFKINTNLRVTKRKNDEIILNNSEAIEEPYNVSVKFMKLDFNSEENDVKGSFNITISLRDKYKLDNYYNLEMLKYRFLCDDKFNKLIIKNNDLDKVLFRFENIGTIEYKKKNITSFNKLCNLVEKVIYISKVKNIQIDFDIDYFIAKEEYINLVYNETNNKNYTMKKYMYWTIYMDKDTDVNNIKKDEKISVKTFLQNFELFGEKIDLKNHIFILLDCELLDYVKNDDNLELHLKTNKSIFELVKK